MVQGCSAVPLARTRGVPRALTALAHLPCGDEARGVRLCRERQRGLVSSADAASAAGDRGGTLGHGAPSRHAYEQVVPSGRPIRPGRELLPRAQPLACHRCEAGRASTSHTATSQIRDYGSFGHVPEQGNALPNFAGHHSSM